MKSEDNIMIVVKSIHHKNTEKVAYAIAEVLNAIVKTPEQSSSSELEKQVLIGFGSGIYDQKHHQTVIDLIDKLPENAGINTFIFSTSGLARKYVKEPKYDPHNTIRNKLEKKGCKILGEFNCAGWNTNSFLRFFGGMYKGRPNTEDLNCASDFAQGLKNKQRIVTEKTPGQNAVQ